MISNKALKFLISLDEKTRKRVIVDFECLAFYPFWDRSLDIALFEGEKYQYRLRTGKLRTIFKIDQVAETILVQKIGYRENVYE
jgi:mRNA-degrading endonuclease RelE of RelBE toxin-antitoxin system